MMNAPPQNNSIPEIVSVNTNCEISSLTIGDEGNLIVIVDDFLLNSDELIMIAEGQGEFIEEVDNYYPGLRADIPQLYSQILAVFFKENIAPIFNVPDHTAPDIIESKFCIATKAPSELVAIQSIPHFDTSENDQIAAVHYLCNPPFQGTSFYQHRTSGYESISVERAKSYFKWLNREATTIGLPNSGYISGDTTAFKRIAKIELKLNRIIFYKSNLLHAGDIYAETDLKTGDLQQRLTANSFIKATPLT